MTRYGISIIVSCSIEMIAVMGNVLLKFSVLFLTPVLMVLAVAVLLSVKNRKENIFAFCFLLLSIHTAYYPIYYTNIIFKYPDLYGYSIVIPYILLPVFYFTIKEVIQENFQIRLFHLGHLIPAIIRYATMIPFFLFDREEKIACVHENLGKFYPDDIPGTGNYLAIVIFLIFYLILIAWQLMQKPGSFGDKYIAIISKNNFSYKLNLYSTILFIPIYFYLFIYCNSGSPFFTVLYAIPFLLLCMFLLYTFIYAPDKALNLNFTGVFFNNKSSSKMSCRDAALHQRIDDNITRLIEQKKIYLDDSITAKKFAKELGISVHQLSFVLNQFRGNRFQDFINSYRIFHAIGIMWNDTLDFSVARIAYESGFACQSTFQCAFKKHTGITPTQWKREFSGLIKPVPVYEKQTTNFSLSGEAH